MVGGHGELRDVSLKRQSPGCNCCCDVDCPIYEDTFDSPLSASWSQIRGTWSTAGGVIMTPDSNAEIIWYGDTACDQNMVVMGTAGAVGDGQSAYVLINYGSGTGPGEGYLFAKFSQVGAVFNVYLGEVNDGGAENILSSILSTAWGGYFKLCYNASIGRLSLVISSGGTVVLDAYPTISVLGKRAGFATGASTTVNITFQSFTVTKFHTTEAYCETCLPECACEFCSVPEDTPCSIVVTLDNLPDLEPLEDDETWSVAEGNHSLDLGVNNPYLDTNDSCFWGYRGVAAFIEDDGGGNYTLWVLVYSWDVADAGGPFTLYFKKEYTGNPPCHSWDTVELTYSPGDSNPPPSFTATPAPTCFVTAS